MASLLSIIFMGLNMLKQIETTLKQLRLTKPLILNITNYVTMDIMANGLLALGATPLMSVCDDELTELIQLAHTVNINIGTLDLELIYRCDLAANLAKQYQKPVILDPVGAGASRIRTETAKHLLPFANIIRGNASEILSLTNEPANTKGVDTTHHVTQVKQHALQLAHQYQNTIVVSGAIDYITNGSDEAEVTFGSPLMTLVTGMGCTLTAIIAAFHAIIQDPFQASVLATHYFGWCGELAATTCDHPGSFRIQFIDALHSEVFS